MLRLFPQNVWDNVLSEDKNDQKVNQVFQFKDNQPNDPSQDIMEALTRFEAEVPGEKEKSGNHTHIILIKDIHGLIRNNVALIRKLERNRHEHRAKECLP